MSELAKGFLSDICANPEDDAPRLVFADWLDEQGQAERAEFIRVQVGRARLPRWDAAQVRLRLREAALLKAHGKAWRGELPEVAGVTWGGFRRGFVAEAKVANWAALRRAAWRDAAPVEALSVRWPKKGDEAAGPVAGLRELSVTGRLVAMADADRLAQSPLLSALRALSVRDCALNAEGFDRLMRSPHLGGLRSLRAGDNSLDNAWVAALCEAASLASLEEIEFGNWTYGSYGEEDEPVINADGVSRLAAWPGLARVRRLDLTKAPIGKAGLRALVRSPHSAGLKELLLYGSMLDGADMSAWKEATPALRLDVLNLQYNHIADKGLKALAEAPCLSELKVLNIAKCAYDEQLTRKVGAAPWLRTLRWLDASENNVDAGWIRALLDARPPLLHTLWLSGNYSEEDDAAPAVAGSPGAASLLELDLTDTELGDEGLAAPGASANLDNLLALRVAGNSCGAAALRAFARSPVGGRLLAFDKGKYSQNPAIADLSR